MKLPHRAYLQVHSDAQALAGALAWFENLNHPALAIPEAIWLQCKTAFYEGLTNVVRHAHQGLPQNTPIEMEVILTDHSVTISIWDRGEGFNIEQWLNHQPPPTDEAEHGRGWFMMSKIADSLTYTRTEDQRNCLRIVKEY